MKVIDHTHTVGDVTIHVEPPHNRKLRARIGVRVIAFVARAFNFDCSTYTGLVECEGCRVTMDEDLALHDNDGVPLCAPCFREMVEDGRAECPF